MSFIWFVIIIFSVFWLLKQFRRLNGRTKIESARIDDHINDDVLFKVQNEFEKCLSVTIGGKENYVYSRLIKPWFNKLARER